MKRIIDFLSDSPANLEVFSLQTRRRKTLKRMITGVALASIIVLIFMIILDAAHVKYSGRSILYASASATVVGMVIIALIEHFISTTAASLLFTISISIMIVLSDLPRAFLEGQSIIFLAMPVVTAGLLLRPWTGYLVAAFFNIAQVIGFFIYHTGIPNIPAMTLLFFLAWIVQHATSGLESVAEKEHEKSLALSESEKAISAQNQRIQEISQKLLEVQERERHLLAAELHDDFGQSLTSLKLMLELTDRATSTAKRKETTAEARELVSELMNRVRNLSLDLRPAMLDDFGLFIALRWLFDRFQSSTGISIQCNYDLACKDRFEPKVETAAYRIVQEALTNVARHASVREAQVNLSTGNVLSIEVCDQGAGFNVAEVIRNETDSIGLSGMHERVRLLGGSMEVTSSPGAGTRVLASIPC